MNKDAIEESLQMEGLSSEPEKSVQKQETCSSEPEPRRAEQKQETRSSEPVPRKAEQKQEEKTREQEFARYARQTALPEIGLEGQEKLSRARVLLVGVGGLGSPIALYLTSAGVGTLGVVDDDVVSLNNLQRQVLYSEKEIGLSKAECAAKRLQQLNSSVKITCYNERLTPENAQHIIGNYDIVVDGCDNFATRFLLSDTCQALGIPYVYGAICGLEGQVTVFCHGPHPQPTYRTLFPDEEQTLRMPHPSKAVIGITPGVVGCVEAGEVLKLICGYGDSLVGKLWTIDLRTLQSYVIQLL